MAHTQHATVFTVGRFRALMNFSQLKVTKKNRLLSDVTTQATSNEDRLKAFALCSNLMQRIPENSSLIPVLANGIVNHAPIAFGPFPEAVCASLMGSLFKVNEDALEKKVKDSLGFYVGELFKQKPANALYALAVPFAAFKGLDKKTPRGFTVFSKFVVEKGVENPSRFARAWANVFVRAPLAEVSALSAIIIDRTGVLCELFPKEVPSAIEKASRTFDGKIASWKIPQVPFLPL